MRDSYTAAHVEADLEFHQKRVGADVCIFGVDGRRLGDVPGRLSVDLHTVGIATGDVEDALCCRGITPNRSRLCRPEQRRFGGVSVEWPDPAVLEQALR